MKQDEAEKLARDLMPRNAGQSVLVTSADLKKLCHAILSGDMKREIENAAFERAARCCTTGRVGKWIAEQIRALIQPPAQKEDGE